MSHLKLPNKVRLATVLCLSSICVILSVARLAAGMHRNVFGKWQFGMAWLSFMLHCEASVAVMAGSIPALRAFYTAHRTQKIESQNEKIPENAKGKALRVLGSMRRKQEPVLPRHERVQPRTSIAKWRQSIIGIIPRRPPTYTGANLNIVDPEGQRYSAAESMVIDPRLVYHKIRKQELQRDGIRVKRETIVWSEEVRPQRESVNIGEVSLARLYHTKVINY